MNENHCEMLLYLLRNASVPQTEAELKTGSGLKPDELRSALDALQRSGQIAVSRKGKYALPERLGLIAGRAFFQHNGSALLRPLDGSALLRIKAGRLMPMPDDLLLARPSGADSCAIEAVCARGRHAISAYVRIERDKRSRSGARFERTRATAVPCDPRIPYPILLNGDLSFLRNHEIALVEIDEYPQDNRPIYGHAERVLGGANSMLARMRATAEDHAFPTEFSQEAEFEASALCREALPAQDACRADLRRLLLFTIDGAQSKDFDDAVSIEVLPDGNYRLGVHIADVSHYVRPGSAIDREARARGTSLYLPACTVPMLPEALSNDLCSLIPDADRLAMSLMMVVNACGRVTDHHLTRSIIRSRARLTYSGVNRLFETGEEISTPEVCAALLQMRELARKLRASRSARGSVDFDLPEAEFVLNEKCEPEEILVPARGEAEQLIEDFMLLANETVARLARDTSLPFVYRVHEPPDPDRIHQLETTLSLSGIPTRLGDHPHPGMLQKVLEASAGNPSIEIIRRTMLHSLRRAQYSDRPLGHYALALPDYCHFTSPIRRYPDLTVHRMLKLMLDGGALQPWEARMPEIASDCSLREQEAVKAERTADGIMKAAYMSHQIGRKFYGTISGVTSWGLYVSLPNTVEGLVHIADMDDYYIYDPQRQQLLGTSFGRLFRLGMRVRVRVLSANVQCGEVNFQLAEGEANART